MDKTENPDSGHGMWNDKLPSSGSRDANSHVQPADLGDANKTLPGEQEDPRLC